MTGQARDWLPANALLGEGVRSAVSGALAAWSEAWFGRAAVRLAHLRPVEPTPAVARTGWRPIGAALSANLPRRNATRLLGWALDVTLELQEQTESDQRLLEGFETRMLADLARRVEAILGVGASSASPAGEGAPPSDGVVIGVGDAHEGDLMQLALPAEALVAFCRARGPARRTGGEPLAPMVQALGPAPVRIAAGLGQATLTLEELRNLAPGDVLVLDTKLDQALDITLAGASGVLAKARLTDLDGHAALAVQA